MRRAVDFGLIVLFVWAASAAALAQPPNREARPGPPVMRGAYLGVNVHVVTPDRVQQLQLKSASGVEVTMVDNDAPAGRAGIREHDVILSLNGNKIENEEQLRGLVRQLPPGSPVNLGLSRGGQSMNVQVVLGDRSQSAASILVPSGMMPQQQELPPGFSPGDMPSMPFELDLEMSFFPMPGLNAVYIGPTGAVLENMTPQLCQYFGIKNGRGGVLVRSVERGSAADNAGLKAGDVVVQVEREWISDIDDWWRTMHARTGPTSVTVVRNKRETTLTIRLPGRRRSALEPSGRAGFDV